MRSAEVRPLRSAPLALVCVASFAIGVFGKGAWAQQPAANMAFVDPGSVVLAPDGAGVVTFDAPVRNSGNLKGGASFELHGGQDGKCVTTNLTAPSAHDYLPNEIAITNFKISGVELPAICYLELQTVVDGGIVNRAIKQIKLTQRYATWELGIRLILGVALSLLTVGAVAILARRKHGEKFGTSFEFGSPAWDFAKSWSSNLTLASAAVSAGIALSSLPELSRYASRSGYGTWVLVISLAVLVAPFVFVLFRRGTVDNGSVAYNGSALSFFASCAITLFSGLAQIVILFLLLDEVFQSYASYSYTIALVLTMVLAGALCWYSVTSMLLTIEVQVKAKEEAAPDNRRGARAETRATVAPPLTWPVL